MRKFTRCIAKTVSKRFKRSRKPIPAAQNIEDTLHLNPPTDHKCPSSCVDQGLSRELDPKVLVTPSGVEETSGPKSASAELRGAEEAAERMKILGGPALSVASAANNASADLDAVDNLPSTYVQPFMIQTKISGHTNWVYSVSFPPDGTRIASGSEDRTARLWDAATGQPLGEPFQGHTSSVSSVSFSPDGTRIASGSESRTVRLWDAATGQPFHECTGILSFAYSLDTTPRTQENLSPSPLISPSTRNTQSICFSSTLGHALRKPADLLEGAPRHDSNSNHVLLGADGWVVGPNHRLLFWLPPASRHPFYTPKTAMVIPRGGAELDLSLMEHGKHWSKCRDAPTS